MPSDHDHDTDSGPQLDRDQLATFVQEYVRREDEPDAGPYAVIAAQLRDPRYLPQHVAEILLARDDVQALVRIVRQMQKPREVKAVTEDTIMTDLEVLFQDSKQARQFSAAIACKKLQADIKGLSQRTINVNVKHSLGTMADADLEAIAKRAAIDGEFTDVTPMAASAPGLPTVVPNSP